MNRKYLLFYYVFTAAFGALIVGLNMSGISGAIDIIEEEFSLSATAKGFVTSAIMVGCFFGALIGGKMSDKYGRKNMISISAVIMTLSAIGCSLSTNVVLLVISRFVGGLGVGVLSAVIPTYISEISPAKVRGTYISLYQLFVVIGILIAYCADYSFLNDENNWRLMLGLPLIFGVIDILMLLPLPESPRWLVKMGKVEKAKNIIAKIGINEEDANEILSIDSDKKEESVKFKELFKKPMTRIVLLGSVLAFFQQITGINVIINYAPSILKDTGIGGDVALVQAIYVGVVNLLFTIVAVWLVDKLGRKIILLTGCAGLVVSLAYLAYAFSAPDENSLGILIALLIYIAFFAVSLAPLMFVVTAEIYPTKIRGTAMALSTGISWACAFLVVQFFPVVMKSLGGTVTFAIFGILSLLAFLFIKIYIPETKGRSLEEIEKIMIK